MKLKSLTSTPRTPTLPTIAMPKQFYHCSPEIFNGWAEETLEKAVEDALRRLTEDPKRSAIAVVRIVRVVRRESAPITVCRVVAK